VPRGGVRQGMLCYDATPDVETAQQGCSSDYFQIWILHPGVIISKPENTIQIPASAFAYEGTYVLYFVYGGTVSCLAMLGRFKLHAREVFDQSHRPAVPPSHRPTVPRLPTTLQLISGSVNQAHHVSVQLH